MKRYGVLIGLAVLFCFHPIFSGDAAVRADADAKLTILFTHDLHSHFLPDRVPKTGGGHATQGGYARLARLIGQEREKAPGRSLLVDAGDIAMGTLFHTEFREEALELRLMGEMGYDAATLGNHDYEFLPSGLAAMLRTARSRSGSLPVLVASNVVFTQDDPRDAPLKAAFTEYPVTPYAVLERNGIRIGLFGIMGRDAADDTPFAAPVTFADIVERSKVVVDLLRNREKVDLVVCLSHAGTKPAKSHSEDEILAGKVPGIDVIISGHTHRVLPEPIRIDKTTIVSAGAYGAYLGILNLDISREAGARVASYRLEKVSAEVAEDPGIAKKIEVFKGIVEQRYLIYSGNRHDQVIAETAFDMPSPAYRQTTLVETGLGDLVTDAFRFAVRQVEGKNYRNVHIAVTFDGMIRDTFLTGGIAVADIFKVLSLGLGMDDRAGHPLLTFYLTGKEIRSVLEVQTSIAPMKHDAQMQVSGVRFTFNPHRVPFDRVVSVAVQDEDGAFRPLQPDKTYRVCVNNYTARMLNYVRRVSHGLIRFTPRDDKGRPVTDWKAVRVDADAGAAGIQELKEWVALTLYMKSLPDRNGNGVPDLPEGYRNPDGRIVAVPSWNPVELFRGAGWITWAVLAAAAVLLIILALVIWWIVRRVRRRAKG
ncbi:MAG: bifunctional metallophosphatase/5'-nucleotidase [Proteobacteria bacterium]|nr:bifunctional metallophosphatase/5'-nucleotidase [Pseudomonadota bacterium]MBU4581977.1 bifunctional metallophosphatase/5'-nucleotidase [Pseudomonadota bacterium]MCG2742269.1 bifunctional metallophosphatase/5'-nucleotidase [Syntrophaceae bacterium]